MNESIKRQLLESADLKNQLADKYCDIISEIAEVCVDSIKHGNKIMFCGNGGSAADASHFAAEMVVRLTADRNRQSLPGLALCTDISVMTATANDFGFENVFARQVEGLGCKGDMLFVISTSGNSKNLVKAVHTARDRGLLTAGLLGCQGGKLSDLLERSLIIPHTSTQRIQEEHIFIIHLLVEIVEGDLFG